MGIHVHMVIQKLVNIVCHNVNSLEVSEYIFIKFSLLTSSVLPRMQNFFLGFKCFFNILLYIDLPVHFLLNAFS